MRITTSPDQNGALAEPHVLVEHSARPPEPLTSFFGRERETAELLDLLGKPDHRLITLLGPGGVGKTRLALRAVGEIAAAGDRRLHFVALAPITNPAIVITSIGVAIGASGPDDEPTVERVAEAIGTTQTLLVIDNFERLVDAGPVLTELLSRCPGLTLLVTSRAVLRLSGEHIVPVKPLETPLADAPADCVAKSPAVQLFRERSDPRRQLSNGEELATIAEMCRRLDGLPLAIELAAARTRMFSAHQLLEQLDGGTAILRHGPRDAPPRLQSMQEMIAWSYDLLTEEEQAMFRVISTFTGGFTFRSAAEIYGQFREPGDKNLERSAPEWTGGAGDTLVADLLLSLIDQSLVEQTATDDGQPRFMLLETIREFGRDRLSSAAEEHLVRGIHAAWFANRIERTEPDYTRDVFDTGPVLLADEQDNLRAAIVWTLEHGEGETAARLAFGLWPYLARNGLYSEARATLQKVLGAPSLENSVLRANLLLDSAQAAWCQSDFQDCRELATQALAICRKIDDQEGIAASLYRLGEAAVADYPVEAVELYQESLALRRVLGDVSAIAHSLVGLGAVLMCAGDYAGAKAAFTEYHALCGDATGEQSQFNFLAWVALVEGDYPLASHLTAVAVARSQEIGAAYPLACSLRLLARATYFRNELADAAEYYQQALELALLIGASHVSGYCVAELAAVVQALGESERAVRWLAFEEAQRERQRLGLTPDESELRETTRKLALAALGEPSFSSAWEMGRSTPAAVLFTEARDWRPIAAETFDRSGVLTRRELEILSLLSTGSTNREIADSLFLSIRTIDTHVSNIITKLEVNSRHAAVEAAQARGLITR